MSLRSFTNANLVLAMVAAISLLLLLGLDPAVLEFRNSRVLDGFMIGLAGFVLARFIVGWRPRSLDAHHDTFEKLNYELSAIHNELKELRLKIDREG